MDLVTGLTIAVTTVAVLLGSGIAVGFVMLIRRRPGRALAAPAGTESQPIEARASGLLVRLDDAVRTADNELGFAIAQFGAEAAAPYAAALTAARAKVAEAFRLRHALDDATPDTARERREWTLQIIALCEQAQALIAEQDAAFAATRALEVNASGTLADLRSRITAGTERVADARATLATLRGDYPAASLAAAVSLPADAEKLLAEASSAADTAEPRIAASGVSDVSTTLRESARLVQLANQALDTVDRTAGDLEAAAAALETLRTKTAADLIEARAERDAAPDADTGSAIIAAITGVEAILARKPDGAADPVAGLDELGDAVAVLDQALASARNQSQRLEHARAAYAGTLVSVTSQLATAQDYIAKHGASVDARTRLAEAVRQLAIAEAETDPVEALDAVRRSVTLARDADALARYDTMALNGRQ